MTGLSAEKPPSELAFEYLPHRLMVTGIPSIEAVEEISETDMLECYAADISTVEFQPAGVSNEEASSED